MTEWQLPHEFVFDGQTIRYEIVGDGPPLVMVHGTPWSSFNLRHLIGAMSRDFTVYYYDLLGYGQSQKSVGDVSLGIQNRILDALIQHWALENPSIIGHDFGGATVLRTHLIDQRSFENIVLIDPVAMSPWGSPFFKHVQQHEAAFAGMPDYIHEAVVRAYVSTAAFGPIAEETLRGIVLPWTGAEGKPAFYRQIAQADSAFTQEVQSRYSDVTPPVLILWGEHDSWIPVAQAEALHAVIPHSQLAVIPDAGHLVIEERPELLVNQIRPFLLGD
ncbi:MAG: alpha/beta hydrolase [Pseudomonadota bacterium]